MLMPFSSIFQKSRNLNCGNLPGGAYALFVTDGKVCSHLSGVGSATLGSNAKTFADSAIIPKMFQTDVCDF